MRRAPATGLPLCVCASVRKALKVSEFLQNVAKVMRGKQKAHF